jgi:pilus assembly protein Flp/PilA
MSAGTANFSDRSADVAQTRDTPVFSTLGGVVPSGPRGGSRPHSGLTACRSSKEFPMLKFCVFLHGFLAQPLRRDDRGVTSVEYALLVALVAIGIVAAVQGLTGALNGTFRNIATTLQGA